MNRGDEICVCLFGAPIDRNELYRGAVGGIGRDDPLNRMSVSMVLADGDVLIVEVEKRK